MRQALVDFDTSLDQIRALVEHITNQTGAALADSKILAVHETQQCGAIVLLTGYFEAFLKEVVQRFIESLSKTGLAFAALPDVIQHRHYEGGGRILTRASEAERRGRPTPFGNAKRIDIAARLHSASHGDGSYQILWEAFAETEANPGPEVVKNIGRNLGVKVKDFWAAVAAKSNEPKQSPMIMKDSLAVLIAKRNECAHTGRVSPAPTTEEIRGFVNLLHSIGEGFIGVLTDTLTQYTRPTRDSSVPFSTDTLR